MIPSTKDKLIGGLGKRSESNIDVDYLKNTMMDEKQNGYGTYQNQQEIAPELERLGQLTDTCKVFSTKTE